MGFLLHVSITVELHVWKMLIFFQLYITHH